MGEKVQVKVLNEERAGRQEDEDNGNRRCDGEQSEDIQRGQEEMFNKEKDKDHDGKDERIKEEENDSEDDEDDQPPVVPLHPAVRRASWTPELAGNVAGRLLLVPGQTKTRRVSHHAMVTTTSSPSR